MNALYPWVVLHYFVQLRPRNEKDAISASLLCRYVVRSMEQRKWQRTATLWKSCISPVSLYLAQYPAGPHVSGLRSRPQATFRPYYVLCTMYYVLRTAKPILPCTLPKCEVHLSGQKKYLIYIVRPSRTLGAPCSTFHHYHYVDRSGHL
jgi:hypothetical protein